MEKNKFQNMNKSSKISTDVGLPDHLHTGASQL